MLSRCKRVARDSSIVPSSFAVRASIVAALAIFTSPLTADAEQALALPNVQIAQAQNDDSMSASDDGSGTTASGTGSRVRSGSSSERTKKYLGEEDGPASGASGQPQGGGEGQGRGAMEGGRRERMRQIIQQMPPEKRDKMLQELKDRRMLKRGISDGAGGGMDNGPDGGGDGGPPFARGPRGEGNAELGGGFKRGNGPRNFGPAGERGGKGLKGGKLFGREPLDLTVLNLTTEQKNKIQAMRTLDGQKSRQLQIDLRQRRDKFKDMLFDPSVSSDQIVGTHREITKLQAQTQEIMLSDFLGIRKLLTKEQLELLPQVRPQEARRSPSLRPGRKGPSDGESEVSNKSIGYRESSSRVDKFVEKANSRRVDPKKVVDVPGPDVAP